MAEYRDRSLQADPDRHFGISDVSALQMLISASLNFHLLLDELF